MKIKKAGTPEETAIYAREQERQERYGRNLQTNDFMKIPKETIFTALPI